MKPIIHNLHHETDQPLFAMVAALKSKAFKWSPKNGCWQRQLTNNAIHAFKSFIQPAIESEEVA